MATAAAELCLGALSNTVLNLVKNFKDQGKETENFLITTKSKCKKDSIVNSFKKTKDKVTVSGRNVDLWREVEDLEPGGNGKVFGYHDKSSAALSSYGIRIVGVYCWKEDGIAYVAIKDANITMTKDTRSQYGWGIFLSIITAGAATPMILDAKSKAKFTNKEKEEMEAKVYYTLQQRGFLSLNLENGKVTVPIEVASSFLPKGGLQFY